MQGLTVRRAYFGEPGAQLHYIEAGNASNETLILLPPSPNTSVYYEKIIPLLAAEHHVIAVDYPGFGGSDRISDVSISGYVKAVMPLAKTYGSICASGFHTGALVANELALQNRDAVRKLVLIDVPYFDAPMRKKYMAKFPSGKLPTRVDDSFKKGVMDRHESLSEDRAFKIWVESLRSGRYQNDAFRAAFSYDCDSQFGKLKHPLTVIATRSGLLEPSRKTAKNVPQAELVEILEIRSPVFEAHSELLAPAILTALSK